MALTMSSVVTFIGWHDSGKTTLVKQVVAELKKSGYRVAVIKSSNDPEYALTHPEPIPICTGRPGRRV